MGNILSNLVKHLESPEGKKHMDDYFGKIINSEKIETVQLERFHNRFSNNLDFIINKIVDKYSSKKYIEREYSLGREPNTELYFFLYKYAEKYGEFTNDEKYNTGFNNGAYSIGNWIFSILNGQGTCINVYNKNGKQY